jgi:hypothetical protein
MTSTEPGELAFPDPDDGTGVGGPPAEAGVTVAIGGSVEATAVGLRLDSNHSPETNGWMAVCRRCGIRTAGPEGLHAPHALQIATAESWLDHDSLGSSIARLKSRRDT